MTLTLSPGRVVRLQIALVASVVLASFGAEIILAHLPANSYRGLVALLNKFVLDSELSIPAWYSSSALLGCSVLLGLIACQRCRSRYAYRFHWFILSLVFLLLSIDELIAVHEMLIVPLRRRLGFEGIFYYAWVIPGLVFVIGFGRCYLNFLMHLENWLRLLFLAAGATYVTGALGMEMAEGPIDQMFGDHSVMSLVAVTIEESLEMIGIAIFTYALLCFIRTHIGTLRIRLLDPSRAGVPGSAPR